MLIVECMSQESKPIYGLSQYPHTDFLFGDNPKMDITKAISENLNAWMARSPGLDTIKKLSVKSRVGFGTVQRAKNGDGNITVQNLEAIASAFGRHATDLITDPSIPYAAGSNTKLIASDKVTQLPKYDPLADYFKELIALADAMDDQGRWQLIGQAKLLANTNPKAKANPAN